MSPYTYIDHTADLGIRVSGRNRSELFKNASGAIFETMLVIGETKTLKTVERSFDLKSSSLPELLVEWLRELLFLFYTKQMVPYKINITFRGSRRLTAKVAFLKLQQGFFRVKMEVKNVTYHNLKVRTTKTGCTATIIFDV